MTQGLNAQHEVAEQDWPQRDSGIHLRQAAPESTAEQAEQDGTLDLGALLDGYDTGGYGVSVGAACAIGVQLCDALHRLHQESEARGMLCVHGRVSFGTVRMSCAGELSLRGSENAQPDVRGRAADVRDAALLVSELLGGQAAAQKLLPRPLSGVLARAIAGVQSTERPLRAADLARALATEAVSLAELRTELRLVWPRSGAPLRLPPPPRLPTFAPVTPLRAIAWEPTPTPSDATRTIVARPSARERRQSAS
jgi:hypothetical protein